MNTTFLHARTTALLSAGVMAGAAAQHYPNG